jgi:Zn-finger nucleic acid-binding protein
MEVATHEGVEIDRCAGCEGLWFDMLELDRLREAPGSENLDSGDAAVGNQHNALGRIECPVCRTRMIKMVDADQPHIWFEHCPSCHGVFLDAGELRDLKAKSPLDLLRWLRIGPRT